MKVEITQLLRTWQIKEKAPTSSLMFLKVNNRNKSQQNNPQYWSRFSRKRQSIPAVPIPPPATAGHFLTLPVPGVGHSQFYRGPGGWALAYPGATPGHLTHVAFVKDWLVRQGLEKLVSVLVKDTIQKTVDWPHSEERKGNKATVPLKQVQYICPIFRFEKQTFYGG